MLCAAAVVAVLAVPVLDPAVDPLDVGLHLGLVGAAVRALLAGKVGRVGQLQVLVLHVLQNVLLVLGQVVAKKALENPSLVTPPKRRILTMAVDQMLLEHQQVCSLTHFVTWLAYIRLFWDDFPANLG